MAKTTKTNTIKTGTAVTFLGYSDGKGDTFEEGAKLTIIGYDPDDKTYALEDESGAQDSLYAKEFEVIDLAPAVTKGKAKAAPAKKAATKKTAAPAAPVEADEEEEIEEIEEEDEEEDSEEEEAPAPVKTKTAKAAKGGKAESKTPAAKNASAKTKGKADAEAEEVPLPKFKMTVSVKSALEENGGNALKAAKTLAESSEKTVFTLGGVLAHIKRTDAHVNILSDEKDEETGKRLPLYDKGNKGFNAYVEAALGIAARKADYYVNLYEKFSQITTEAAIGKIGWTKLRELLPLELDKDNVDEWLDYAKESSTAEVKDAVTKTLVDSGQKLHGNSKRGKGDTEKVTYKLHFFADQNNVIVEAIDKAREVIGEDATPSQCFAHIAQEWLNMDYEPADYAGEEDDD